MVNSEEISFGSTPLSVVRDLGVVLMMADDSLCIDRESVGYELLHSLANACWSLQPLDD